MITLEYNGSEQSLADWGFSMDSPTLQVVNLAPSRYLLDQPGGSLVSDPAIPFRGKVIVRRHRTFSGGAFTGGYVAFIGYRTAVQHYCTATDEGLTYTFENAWHFLDNTPFQQPYAAYNTVSGSLEFKNVSELLLFSRLNGSNQLEAIDAGGQIEEILQFVIDIFVAQGMTQPFIIGQVDPSIPFPTYQAREMMCGAAILKCLELSPDVVCHFDYTTSLGGVPTPTVHFYARASRTAKTLAVKNNSDHVALNIVPRPDLVPRAVILTYKISGSYNGNIWVLYAIDKYGPNGQNHASDPNGGLAVVLQTIELMGSSQDNVYGSLEVEAVDCNAATQAARKTWWGKFFPEFADTKTRNVVFGTATIKDKSGAAVSLATYPNRLLPDSGTILPWMSLAGGAQVIGKWVTVECEVAYEEYDAVSGGNQVRKIDAAKPRKLKQSMVVTNGETGDYSATGSFTAGESVPGFVSWDGSGNAVFANGIASQVYTALATLQYEGRDVRVQAEISNATNDGPFITLAHSLNLTGGNPAWATMGAQIQTISENDGSGEISITFGPARHISAGDLAALFQFNRLRRVWWNPNLRASADLGTSGNSIQMPDKVPAENSIAAFTAAVQTAVVANFDE